MKRRHILVVATACVAIIAAGLLSCSRTREDAAITNDVQASINADASLAGKAIAVQTAGGIVALSGTVASELEKASAETAAKQVAGVKSVTNNLQVVTAAVAPPPERPQVVAPTPIRMPAKPSATKGKSSKPMAVTTSPSEIAKTFGEPTTQPKPKLATVTIPEGTNLSIRLIDAVDTAKNKEGDVFRASLDSPVVIDDKTVIAKHSNVEVKLVSTKSAGHFTGSSTVVLVASKIEVGGKMYDLRTGEFTKQGSSRGTRTAVMVGGGAAAGALIGGIVGGGKGAAIGAAAGAGTGTGVQALTNGEQIQLPSETVLEFQLKSPITVTPSADAVPREKAG